MNSVSMGEINLFTLREIYILGVEAIKRVKWLFQEKWAVVNLFRLGSTFLVLHLPLAEFTSRFSFPIVEDFPPRYYYVRY